MAPYHLLVEEKQLIKWLLVILFISRATAIITPGFSVDDYLLYAAPPNYAASIDQTVAQGRILQALQFELQQRLGINGPMVSGLFGALGLASYCLVALLCRRWWQLKVGLVPSLIVASLIALHPYQAEYWTFRTVMSSFGACVLPFVALELFAPRLGRMVLGAVALSCGLLIYQVPFNWALTALLFTVLSACVISPPAPGRFWQFLKAQLGVKLVGIGAGIALYLTLNRVVLKIYHANMEERGRMIRPSEIIGRMKDIAELLHRIFIADEPLAPQGFKVLFFALTLLGILRVVRAGFAAYSAWPQRLLYLLITGTLFVAAALCMMGLSIPLRVWWPAPRLLTAVSIFMAGVTALCATDPVPWLRRFALAIAALAALSGLGIQNRVFSEQIVLNKRDMLIASRIVSRLEMHPKWADAKVMVVVGGHWNYPLQLSTAEFHMNMTAMYPSQSKERILHFVAGRWFPAASPAQVQRAEEYAKSAQPWPAAGSTTVIDDIAVVYLPAP